MLKIVTISMPLCSLCSCSLTMRRLHWLTRDVSTLYSGCYTTPLISVRLCTITTSSPISNRIWHCSAGFNSYWAWICWTQITHLPHDLSKWDLRTFHRMLWPFCLHHQINGPALKFVANSLELDPWTQSLGSKRLYLLEPSNPNGIIQISRWSQPSMRTVEY